MENNIIALFSAKRLEALADGVFAIVMTLLVLELAIPALSEEPTNAEITNQILALWPKIVSYFLSFFVLGIYWLIHHKIFENIKFYNSTLAWINILFLMVVSLIPFTTSLIGEHFLKSTPTFIYGMQLLAMFLLGFSLFIYSTSKNRLVDESFDPGFVKDVKLMGYVYFIILIIAIGFSLFIPLISICIYGFIVVMFVLLSALGKEEFVMSASHLKSIKK